jgi:hypothetical protein
MSHERVDILFSEVLLLTIAYVLLLKGLNLRRYTPLGKSLAINNVMFSFAYFTIALGVVAPFFSTEGWSYVIRFGILLTATRVLWEMQRTFGGWKNLHHRAWRSALDWVQRKPQRYETEVRDY